MVRMVHPENNVLRLCEEYCPDHHSINQSRKTLYNKAGYCSYDNCLLNKCPNCDCKDEHNLPFGQWCCRGVSPPSPSVQSTRSLNRRFVHCSLSLSRQGPRFSIRMVIGIFCSDTVFVQLNQFSQILSRQCCLDIVLQVED